MSVWHPSSSHPHPLPPPQKSESTYKIHSSFFDMVSGQYRSLRDCTFREIVSSSAVLPHIEVVRNLVATPKSQHGMIVESIISKEENSA